MNNDLKQRVIDKLVGAQNILLVLSQSATVDDLSSALALRAFLHKLEKEVVVISPGGVSEKLGFLPGADAVETGLAEGKSFVIDLSTKNAEVEELSYKKESERLSIFIKPKTGQFREKDVSVRTSDFPFDLVVCIGVSSLEDLGQTYSQNTALFFETPIVNLDHRLHNENYGQLNLIELNVVSNAEIVFDLINEYEQSLFDHEIATNLLAGIITETNSFQHSKTSPQSFIKASQLVGLGGNQQTIISRLFKNKSLGFLKLWGRVLARLKQEGSLIVYSLATRSDVEKSNASEEDVAEIIKEMAAQLNFAKLFMFLREIGDNQTEVFIINFLPLNLPVLFAVFQPRAIGAVVKFVVPHGLLASETEVLSVLRREISGIS